MTIGQMVLWLWTAGSVVLLFAGIARAMIFGAMMGRGREVRDPKKFAGFPIGVAIAFWPVVLAILAIRARRAVA